MTTLLSLNNLITGLLYRAVPPREQVCYKLLLLIGTPRTAEALSYSLKRTKAGLLNDNSRFLSYFPRIKGTISIKNND